MVLFLTLSVLLSEVALADPTPLAKGVQALKDGRFEEAAGLLEQAATLQPESADARWELGWARWMLKDYAGARTAWEQVSTLDPERAELSQWLAAARTRASLSDVEAAAIDVPLTASEGRRVRIAAAGDTMMGTDLRRGPSGLAPGDGEVIFEEVAPIFKAADVAFLNLEGPLADGLQSSKCKPGSTSCYAFRTPTRYANALVYAGIDMVSLANNHAFDLGAAGQQATMDALGALGIAHAGRYGDTGTVEVGGLKIGLVAAHSGSCCLNVNEIDEVVAAIRLLDRDHDLVVFSFHGGAEGSGARRVPGKVEIAWGERRGDVKALARAAVDAGADLVLGHGPHVLRAMEVYKGRLIAYSLGNFTGYRQFGTKGGYGGHTVIVDAELADNGVLVSARLHAIRLDGESIPRLDADGVGLGHVRELSALDFPETGVKVGDDGALSW